MPLMMTTQLDGPPHGANETELKMTGSAHVIAGREHLEAAVHRFMNFSKETDWFFHPSVSVSNLSGHS